MSSTSSSSSSSSGIATITVNQYCVSSVGVNHSTHFEVDNSDQGRLDLPEVAGDDRGTLAQGRLGLEYSNPTTNPVPMSLWYDHSLDAIDLEFPPTDGWQILTVDIPQAHQFSLTAKGDEGSVSFRDIIYRWRTSWEFDEVLEIGRCPSQPLPGVGDPIAQAPTARIKGRNDPCNPWRPSLLYVAVDRTLTFDASDSTDRNIEPLTYYWDFQDGTTAFGKQVSHTYTEPGVYFVPVTVTDSSGLSDREVIQVRAHQHNPANQAPRAVITANRTRLLRPFTSTTLWGDISFDQDGDTLNHVWYNSFTEEIVYGDEIDIDFSGHSTSSQEITLGVSDGRGEYDTNVIEVSLADYPGQDCEITYVDRYPYFAMEVKLFNNTSTRVDDWQVQWQTRAALTELSLTFNSPYSLGVSDAHSFSVSGNDIPDHSWVSFTLRGKSASLLQDIDFESQNGLTCIDRMPPRQNHSPTAKIAVTQDTGEVPLTVYFSAEEVFDPDGDTMLSYLWDFGDGTKAFGPSVRHTYTWAKDFDVRLLVSDGVLTASGDSNGGLTSEVRKYVRIPGNQPIGCKGSLSPTGRTPNEYRIRVWYGFIRYSNSTNPVELTSGRVTLSQPVFITQAATETNIKLNTLSDDISFTIDRQLQPEVPEIIEFFAVIDDIDNTFFTSCTHVQAP